MNALQLNKKQMAQEFSRLFFLCDELRAAGKIEELEENSIKQDYLLKELKGSGYDVISLMATLKTKQLFQVTYDTIIIFTDGGVRNNHLSHAPNVGASAFCVYGNNKMLTHECHYFGESIPLPSGRTAPADTVLAEYHGLLHAIRFVNRNNVKAKRFVFLTDSTSVVDHVTKKSLPFKANFQEYVLHLREEFKTIPNAEIRYIPRTQNKVADRFVNQILQSKGDVAHATNKRRVRKVK